MKNRLLSPAAFLIGLHLVLHAEPAPPAGFTFVRAVGGIEEYRLDSNGLRVLLLPQKLAPVATFMVTYHVGSRNEVTGTTGATHLLEHLMFKGTAKFDRTRGTGFDQVLERAGAETNATTWFDRTNYFATVPTAALPLLIEVESDRMRNLALRESDRRPEMTVVRNEFERGENMPYEALEKEVRAIAFLAHPYHHETIGWRSDIERVPIEKLRAFYDTFYWPNNATVTVIGDFEPSATLATIKEHYGPIAKSPHPFPEVYTEEPEQSGPRRVILKRAGELGIVMLAHKIPQATHADWPAIEVLSAVLTEGKLSRCYRALTDKNLTVEVTGDSGFTHDPSLHLLTAMLNPGVKHDEVERRMLLEIERIKNGGVTGDEVNTAVAGLIAKHEFLRDGSFAQAAEINECIAVGDWTLFVTLEEKLKSVTTADVQRVAKKYLLEDHSVTGWFVPTEGSGGGASKSATVPARSESFDPKEVIPPKTEDAGPDFAAPGLAGRITRETIAGIDVIACPTPVKGVVRLLASIPAGEGQSPDRSLAYLTAGMLERGTRKHDQFALAALLEKIGATIEYKVNTDTVDFTVKCLSRDMPFVLSVFAEELRQPAFAKEEFVKLKKEAAAEMQQALEDTDKQVAIAFSRTVLPKNHPAYRSTTADLVSGIARARLDEVRAFHAAHYGPRGMHLIAAGDFEVPTFRSQVKKVFEGWKTQTAPEHPPFEAATPVRGETTFFMPDKSSVSVIIGQPSGVRADDPDWPALHLATHALGSGFTSRLTGNVRDREGLTYGIGAKHQEDSFRPGVWGVRGTFAPSLLEKGLASTRRQIESWWRDGINAEELAYRKSCIIGQFLVNLETTEGLADQLLLCVQRGFDVKWVDEFPGIIKALTLEQTNAAIRKHLDPAKMATVKAGTLAQ